MLPYRLGGGYWGSLMIHSTGSIATQRENIQIFDGFLNYTGYT
jgi:hypothetical protein